MIDELALLVNRLIETESQNLDIISWASPVPSFGKVSSARIATVGLNPSNLEFVDSEGNELDFLNRRFPTLKSLGISLWSHANDSHFKIIEQSCEEYFSRNPYDTWFKQLDRILVDTSMSYYFPNGQVCHLDLIPYATTRKWGQLSQKQRNKLLDISKNILGELLRKSSITTLLLNGQTVIESFQKISNTNFKKELMEEWTLPRKESNGVYGYAYEGWINSIGDIDLKRSIYVLGYNHNIQSSLGVSNKVRLSIREWISQKTKEKFNETC